MLTIVRGAAVVVAAIAVLATTSAMQAGEATSHRFAPQTSANTLQFSPAQLKCAPGFKNAKVQKGGYFCEIQLGNVCAPGYNPFPLKVIGNKVQYECAKPVP